MLPYIKPGDPRTGELFRELKGAYRAVFLANHGPVVSGKDLFSAVYVAEELEETAKLLLALRGYDIRLLSIERVEELKKTFGDK